MLEELMSYIKELFSSKGKIVLDDFQVIEDKKGIVVFTGNAGKMGSVELHPDGTCDLMIVEIASEQILYSEATQFSDVAEGRRVISIFLEKIIESDKTVNV